MSGYVISDLESEYVDYLYEHIPLLEYSMDGTLLLQYILNYCKECESTKTSKESNIRLSSLAGINLFLKKISGIVKKSNGFNSDNNNEYRIIYNENKKTVTKKNNIDALGLIEGIILCTLNYYKIKNKNNNKKFPNINVNISPNKTKLNLKMSIAPGKDLGNTIIDLYKSNKVIDEKNTELFNILIEISKKLDYLQKNYGFIHGDFHSGNIFVDKKIDEKNGKEKYIITFIDFEYSTIKLPSNKNIILISPVSENISRKYILNLYEEYGLKALDLFHLIEDFKSFKIRKSTINKFNGHFDKFNEFINKLNSLYPNKFSNGKIHISSRSLNFFNESYSNLYPEDFSKLKLNNLSKKRPTEISHHSLNSQLSKK